MANTTFANLKIGALRRAGMTYNANDATRLELAGGIINDVLGFIQSILGANPFCMDIDNTVNTVADQAYVDLSETDILEVLQVYQRSSQTKLTQIHRLDFAGLVPDTTVQKGLPELAFAVTQILSGAGVNTWRIYLINTPASAVTSGLRYDYIKNIRFTADGTGANAEYCALPNTFDDWIYAEFKPRYYGLIAPQDKTRYEIAIAEAERVRAQYAQFIRPKDKYSQMGAYGEGGPMVHKRVATTSAP